MTKNKIQKNSDWKNIQIGKLLDYEQPTNYIVSSTNYDDKYKIPVLTAGKSFILGYTDEAEGIFSKEKLPVIIFDDFTTAHKFVDFPFKVKSSAMKILKNKNKKVSDINFVYSWMIIHPFIVGQHKRNYLSEYQYQDVLLPPLSEQKWIVGVLEVWDEGIKKLERKIKIKENIKKGIASQIMNCELSIVNGKKVFAPKLRLPGFSGKWEEKKLGDVSEIKKGEQLNKEFLNDSEEFPSYSGGIIPSGYTNKFNTEKNKIIISEGGNSCGYVNFIKEDFWAGGHCYVVSEKKVNKNFLFQFLKISEIKIMKLRVGSGLPNVQKMDIENFKIRLPKLKEQKAIAEVLTAADEEIEMLRKKLKILKDQKKFLLNNLVTGNIRIVND